MATDELDSPGVDDAEPLSFRARTARVLAVLAVVLMAFLWGWALFFPPSTKAPGTLDDPAFATTAESICSAAAAELAGLPKAFETPTAAERAAVIVRSDAILSTMLDRLQAAAPPADTNDGTNVAEWLADWRTYVSDRAAYASALASDPSARFYVTVKERRQVSEPIDFFATFNKMYNCVTPDDIE